MTDSTIALIEPVAWRWRSGFCGEKIQDDWTWLVSTVKPERSGEATDFQCEPLVSATELTTLLQRVEEMERRELDMEKQMKRAEESAVEASIRAHAWMEAHDKLQAGKPYSFPSPADKPALLESRDQAEAERDAALERVAHVVATRRWNIERLEDDLLICEGNHDKSDDCEYVRYTKAETAEARVATLEKSNTTLLQRCEKAEAEAERIKAINVKHCQSVNTLLVDGSRWQTRAETAEAQVKELRAVLKLFWDMEGE